MKNRRSSMRSGWWDMVMRRWRNTPSCTSPLRMSRALPSKASKAIALLPILKNRRAIRNGDRTIFSIPPELEGHPLHDEYVDTIRLLFKTYAESLEPVRSLVLERFPRRENEKDEAWDRRIRSKYVDVCRFLLPAASLANVGMTANARVLENMIRKMFSHELAEVRQIGEKVKEVALG